MRFGAPKDAVAFERGCADARQDIADGRPRLYWGTRSEWGQFMEDLFLSNFQVIVEHTDCSIDDSLDSYRKGYNSTTVEHIEGTYGSGAFEEARAKVTKFRTEYYKKNVPPPA